MKRILFTLTLSALTLGTQAQTRRAIRGSAWFEDNVSTANSATQVISQLFAPAATVQTLAAASQIAATSGTVRITGSNAPVTLTSTPAISAGSNGQTLRLLGTSAANTVTLQDDGTFYGSKLRLGASSRTVALGNLLTLAYDSTNAYWYEISWSVPQVLPTDLSSLVLWLRADALSGTNGTPITQWPDQSGNGYSFGQTNSSKKPYLTNAVSGLNSRPAVAFSGSQGLTNGFSNGASAFTIFAVYNPHSDSAAAEYLMDDQGTYRLVLAQRSGNNTADVSWYDNSSWHDLAAISTSAQIMEWDLVNSAASSMYRNGTSLGSSTNAVVGFGGGVTCLGANSVVNFAGANLDLAEFLVFSRALSSTELTSMRRYLGSKYGITVP